MKDIRLAALTAAWAALAFVTVAVVMGLISPWSMFGVIAVALALDYIAERIA